MTFDKISLERMMIGLSDQKKNDYFEMLVKMEVYKWEYSIQKLD